MRKDRNKILLCIRSVRRIGRVLQRVSESPSTNQSTVRPRRFSLDFIGRAVRSLSGSVYYYRGKSNVRASQSLPCYKRVPRLYFLFPIIFLFGVPAKKKCRRENDNSHTAVSRTDRPYAPQRRLFSPFAGFVWTRIIYYYYLFSLCFFFCEFTVNITRLTAVIARTVFSQRRRGNAL